MTKPFSKIGTIRFLDAVFCSLNIGFALAFALQTYLNLFRGAWLAEILYGEINRIFHYFHRSEVSFAVVFVVIMLAAAETVLLLLLLILQFGVSALTRAILDPIACVLALAAAPACWMSSVVIGWPPAHLWNIYPTLPGLHGFWFLGIEVASVLVLLYVARRLQRSFLYSVVILVAHYSFWARHMWPAIIEDLMWHPVLQASAVVCPFSGLAWLLYSTALRERQSDERAIVETVQCRLA